MLCLSNQLYEIYSYLKEFRKKILDTVPDKDGVRETIEKTLGTILSIIIRETEKRAKASETCQLPEVIPGSFITEYKSIIVPIGRAFNNLNKNN